ncbi:MAG: hypothetical protein MJ076_04535 [Clostridia bacterium]|nr:hypothetical protein [Clostridia bacterium]
MKKCVGLIVAFILLLSGCGNVNNKPDKTENIVKLTGKSLNKEIIAASDFSEGLAFVKCKGEKDKYFCINKKGEIVFETNEQPISIVDGLIKPFVSGLSVIYSKKFNKEGFIDKKGKIVMPNDVGAFKFEVGLLNQGYIIADVRESDFQSSVYKAGILDTNFNWIVEPSEQFRNLISRDDEDKTIVLANTLYSFSYDYIIDDYLYVDDLDKYINIKTMEEFDKSSIQISLPSNFWSCSSAGVFTGTEGEKTYLDLTPKYDTLTECSKYFNGKSLAIFCSGAKYYFSLIDEQGNTVFEPKEFGTEKISQFEYDGNYIVLGAKSTFHQIGSDSIIKSYDLKGNELATMDTSILDNNKNNIWSYNDGVLLLKNNNTYTYYDVNDFSELF